MYRFDRANGSGKTTFIKTLLGMVIPDSGFITFNGKILEETGNTGKIGYMPQIGRYPENMSMAQVFEMIKDIRKKFTDGFDEELIESFGLNNL